MGADRLGFAGLAQAHPHYSQWIAFLGLVLDGVSFSRNRLRGSSGRSYSHFEQSLLPDGGFDTKHALDRAKGNAHKHQKGRKRNELKTTKTARKARKQSKSARNSVKQSREHTEQNSRSLDGTASDSRAAVSEQRDLTVHSSQAKVTVVASARDF